MNFLRFSVIPEDFVLKYLNEFFVREFMKICFQFAEKYDTDFSFFCSLFSFFVASNCFLTFKVLLSLYSFTHVLIFDPCD